MPVPTAFANEVVSKTLYRPMLMISLQKNVWGNVVRLVTGRAGHHEDITGRQLFEADCKLETESDWFVGHTTKLHMFPFCSSLFGVSKTPDPDTIGGKAAKNVSL